MLDVCGERIFGEQSSASFGQRDSLSERVDGDRLLPAKSVSTVSPADNGASTTAPANLQTFKRSNVDWCLFVVVVFIYFFETKKKTCGQ